MCLCSHNRSTNILRRERKRERERVRRIVQVNEVQNVVHFNGKNSLIKL